MALENMTDDQIEQKLNMVERLIACGEAKSLPTLNQMFQRLIDEQVCRDLEREES